MTSQTGSNEPTFLEDQLEQFQCDLLSLEVSLQNALKSRAIPEPVYQPRFQYIQKLRQGMAHLKAILQETQTQDVDEDMGFPNLAHCSVEEIRVCDAFVSNRLDSCQELYQTLNKLYAWIGRAFEGKDTGLIGTLRLSKLKRWLHQVENEHIKTELDEKELERLLAKMASNIENNHDRLHLSGNLEALVRLFREIDGLNNRITSLRSSLARHEDQIRHLEDWLAANEPDAKKQPPSELPSLHTLEEARQDLSHSKLYPTPDAENRLTLARTFINSCLNEDSSDEAAYELLQGSLREKKENEYAN